MRDEDRINMYYQFGTADCRSEAAEKEKKSPGGAVHTGIRIFKLAALAWTIALRNLTAQGKSEK